MRLLPSRSKTVTLLAVSLAFTAIGVWAIGTGQGIGWFVALFFGVCLAGFAIHLWPGASYLQLLPEGFVVRSLFRTLPLIRWENVSEFHVAPVPGSGAKMVVYSCDSSRHPRLAALNRSLVGATDALPDSYGR